jgi:glycosyltransferase involved in cell wall biosynthesis
MPVYNAEKYLAEAIESILTQTFTDFEFIIINDGSTDESLSIIQSYEKIDSRIIVISRENKGLVASLNEGIDLARGEYIARMDADDISLPERFERQLAILNANNDIGLLSAGYTPVDSDGHICSDSVIHPSDPAVISLLLVFCSPICHPCVMVKSDILKKYKYYNIVAEDHDLWCRLSEITIITNIEEPLIFYRVHQASLSQRKKNLLRLSTFKTGVNHFFKSISVVRNAKINNNHNLSYKNINWNRAKMVLYFSKFFGFLK